MSKYLIEVEVIEDKLRRYNGIDVGEENEYADSIESLIIQEMGWVEESGIYLTSVVEIPKEKEHLPSTSDFAEEISEIINQDSDEVTDGQCIDQIFKLLKDYGIYKERV